ncbi:MAG: Mammalian cell entry related domain protein [Gemmatimonadetes bacterium]|nr:Mammalian cell entry related domain protein [Gemmatimonadota bacterium]
MARRLSWSDVRGGIIACAAIAAVVFVVMKFARVGVLRGETMTLYARVGEARGIMKGSEVWLSGQKIGKITDIRFVSPDVADTSSRIEIKMQVLARNHAALHKDAIAQIRAGGTIIGAPVVYISPGTPKAAEMADGDTVNTHPQADIEGATGQFGMAAREFPVIISNVKVLTAQLTGTEGTVGAFVNTPGAPGMKQLTQTRLEAGRLGARLSGGGTVGQFMQGGLTQRANRVMARADSVRTLLASGNTSFGRLRRDSTLLNEVADIRNELSIVRSFISEPRGTAGRVLRDSALTNGVADAERQMSLLFADIKKHPLKYIKF